MKRLITGLAIGTCWLLLLLKGSFALFWLVIVLVAALALTEYYAMALTAPGPRKLRPAALCIALLPVLAAYSGRPAPVAAGLLLALLCCAGLTMIRYAALDTPFVFLNRTAFGALYGGFLGAHLPLLMALERGNAWLLLLTATVAATDAGAYYTGTWFGKHKLCPAISPGKTIEGFLGGLVSAVLAALAAAALLFPGTNTWQLAGLALVLSCAGAAGDLTESIIKRACGVKDSGILLPGHGGVLDRADSLLFAAPVLFYLLHFEILFR